MELVKTKNLVENLSERELRNPEGAGLEVRAGEIFEIQGEGFLGEEERKTPETKLVAKYGRDKSYTLVPNGFVLVKTLEKVNVPKSLELLTFSRSTLFRSGVLLLNAQTDPGYYGELVFGLKNLGKNNFIIELGARMAKLIFCEVKGKTNPYRGQWKGGRVSASRKESQI